MKIDLKIFFSVNTIQKISDKLSKDLYDNKVRGLITPQCYMVL